MLSLESRSDMDAQKEALHLYKYVTNERDTLAIRVSELWAKPRARKISLLPALELPGC